MQVLPMASPFGGVNFVSFHYGHFGLEGGGDSSYGCQPF